MHTMQTTPEDIHKWWGAIVTEINILQNILFQKFCNQIQYLLHSSFNPLMSFKVNFSRYIAEIVNRFLVNSCWTYSKHNCSSTVSVNVSIFFLFSRCFTEIAYIFFLPSQSLFHCLIGDKHFSYHFHSINLFYFSSIIQYLLNLFYRFAAIIPVLLNSEYQCKNV